MAIYWYCIWWYKSWCTEGRNEDFHAFYQCSNTTNINLTKRFIAVLRIVFWLRKIVHLMYIGSRYLINRDIALIFFKYLLNFSKLLTENLFSLEVSICPDTFLYDVARCVRLPSLQFYNICKNKMQLFYRFNNNLFQLK